jgi:DNA-binding beta-propeller fold protein YncE
MRKTIAILTVQAFALLLGVAGTAVPAAAQTPTYRFIREIPVGGEGGWDYLAEDPPAHRLYVSHGTSIVVIDAERGAVIGHIDSLPGVHGFAVAPELGLGFASNGRENTAAVVDLKTLTITRRVATGENPDAILYVPGFEEVYTFNGRGHSATVFEAKTGKVIATIPLSGKPEFAVFDPAAGRVYNNIEDQNEIVVIDAKTHAVVATWPIAPGEEASGLAIDLAHHRLFAVCGNQYMVMVNSTTGAVVDTVRIGGGADAARFDPATGLAFASNGEGTVTIAHEKTPDHLEVVQTLNTARSARTMTLDPLTHRIYLSAATYEPAAPADSGAPRQRPRVVPGSFRVLVYGIDGK